MFWAWGAEFAVQGSVCMVDYDVWVLEGALASRAL